MPQSVERDQRELLVWNLAGVIPADNVLHCLVWCGVVHQFAVVLGKYPVIPLPVVAHIEAVLQLLGVELPEAF